LRSELNLSKTTLQLQQGFVKLWTVQTEIEKASEKNVSLLKENISCLLILLSATMDKCGRCGKTVYPTEK
jgi:hypothetical protein